MTKIEQRLWSAVFANSFNRLAGSAGVQRELPVEQSYAATCAAKDADAAVELLRERTRK